MWHLVWPILVGYSFSVLVGHAFVRLLSRLLWASIEQEYPVEAAARKRHEHHPAMVGILERGLYTACWQFGRPEFVAVWLALKVSGQWKSWSEDRIGRIPLNLFLIGNGFSVAYGVVGGAMIEWISKNNVLAATAVPIAITVASSLFSLWVWLARPKPKSPSN